MENEVTVAIAQSRSVKGDVEANVAIHAEYARLALESRANIIIFPELSLTGYEPGIASASTLSLDDKRLSPLHVLSREYRITIVAGAPVMSRSEKPNIGALVIAPERSMVYRKNYLHAGEEESFSESDKQVGIIEVGAIKIGLAICADVNHEDHAKDTAAAGADVYAAGVLMVEGYSEAAAHMQHYARRYYMLTLMANYGLPTGNYLPAGRSAAWGNSGSVVAEARENGEELVIVTGNVGRWSGRTLVVR